jgi:hypothetical protein
MYPMAKSSMIIKSVSNLRNNFRGEESSHIWQFSRVGGVNRVNIETGQDLLNLCNLDQKLWTALSCPVHGLEIDPKTLELIDKDSDERIRVPEVLEAVRWLLSLIKDPDEVIKGNSSLPLSSINDNCEEGQKLLASARHILNNLGLPEDKSITVEQSSDTVRIFKDTKFNGDGIITEDSTEDESVKKIINDIIISVGSLTDRNGKEGVSIDQVNLFYKSLEEFSSWYAIAEANPKIILPFGELTAEALKAYEAVKSKIGDYFLRCRLVDFDSESAFALNSLLKRYEGINDKDLTLCIDEIAGFPLSKIEANQPLQLNKHINPAWVHAMERFKEFVIKPLFPNRLELTEAEWMMIEDKFTPYVNWQTEKVGTLVESIGLLTIRDLLSGSSKETLVSLIEQDKALEGEFNNVLLVNKLTRYYRDLYKLLKNYVTFFDFYSPHSKAIFQAGSLYIDQRCCNLCIKVSDMNKHNIIARSSGLCLIYCSCFSKTRNESMIIAAALTDGDIDNIEIGRNAIFYDRQGDDWDATIIKVIDNPISIRQAFWSPYRKVSRFISKQIEKVASSKEKDIDATAASKIEQTSTRVDSGLKESVNRPSESMVQASSSQSQPFDIGKFVGIFAAISLAIGAIGTAIASILTGFFGLALWKMPLAFAGVIICISGPSMIIAWFKLRKRNLAPLLDANGWAINARATINIPFGNTLTHLAALPENSKLNLLDPFDQKKKPIVPIIIISVAIIALVIWGLLHWEILHF